MILNGIQPNESNGKKSLNANVCDKEVNNIFRSLDSVEMEIKKHGSFLE